MTSCKPVSFSRRTLHRGYNETIKGSVGDESVASLGQYKDFTQLNSTFHSEGTDHKEHVRFDGNNSSKSEFSKTMCGDGGNGERSLNSRIEDKQWL